MGYESLSTVIVLVIVVLMLAVWLPRRTVNGMKHVMEHREDRYSSSLHLVDADSGTKFSDVRTPQAKGAIMQQASRTRPCRRRSISHRYGVCAARPRVAAPSSRECWRRPRSSSSFWRLFCVFSPLFALIPGGLLLVVVGLGINAAATRAHGSVRWRNAVPGDRKPSPPNRLFRPVRRMRPRPRPRRWNSGEIRRALRESEEEKARIQARREARHADVVDVDSVVVEERTDDDRIVTQAG